MLNKIDNKQIQTEQFDALLCAAILWDESKFEYDKQVCDEKTVYKKVCIHWDQLMKQENKIIKKKKYIHRCRQVGTIAAIILLVVLISFPIALAVSSEFRTTISTLIMNRDTERKIISIELQKKEVIFKEIPDTWKGNYYFTYLPEGYILDDDPEWNKLGEKVRYIDPELHIITDRAMPETNKLKSTISLSEWKEDKKWDFAEDKWYLEPISFGGTSGIRATMSEWPEVNLIIWTSNDEIICLSTVDVGIDETLRIANGICRINIY